MNCKRCNRTLKKPTLSGFGETCARKADRETETAKSAAIVKPLSKSMTGNVARRSYLVLTAARETVVIFEIDGELSADCTCHAVNGEIYCEHIKAAAAYDAN